MSHRQKKGLKRCLFSKNAILLQHLKSSFCVYLFGLEALAFRSKGFFCVSAPIVKCARTHISMLACGRRRGYISQSVVKTTKAFGDSSITEGFLCSESYTLTYGNSPRAFRASEAHRSKTYLPFPPLLKTLFSAPPTPAGSGAGLTTLPLMRRMTCAGSALVVSVTVLEKAFMRFVS